MDFNLQTFLAEMRDEQREDLRALASRVDTVLATLHDHDTRLVIVENARKTIRWLGATIVVAAIGAILDFLFTHLKP